MTSLRSACPACGAMSVVPVVMGFPGASLFAAAERGEVVLGGCVISSETPEHPVACTECGWRGQVLGGHLAGISGSADWMEIRIGTWNCRNTLGTHPNWFDLLGFDIAVVQECTETEARALDGDVRWTGYGGERGMAIVARNDYSLAAPSHETETLEWCLPVDIHDRFGDRQFTFLGIWTVKAEGDGRPSYSGQLAQVIQEWATALQTDRVVIAGDFNAAPELANPGPHLRNLGTLTDLGARSAFHESRGIDPTQPGSEGTLLFGATGQERWCHCDYVFVSNALATDLVDAHLGPVDQWVTNGRSDHRPLTARVEWSTPAEIVPLR